MLEAVPVELADPRKKVRAELDLEPGREGFFNGPGMHVLVLVAVGALALMGVYKLLDRVTETDSKRIEKAVKTMTGAVAQRKLDIAFDLISDRFVSPSGRTKEQFRALADAELASGRVTAVEVWPCEFPELPDRTRESKVSFQFKLRGDLGGHEQMQMVCDAVFVWDMPGVWRLLRCRILDSIHNNEEISLPGF